MLSKPAMIFSFRLCEKVFKQFRRPGKSSIPTPFIFKLLENELSDRILIRFR